MPCVRVDTRKGGDSPGLTEYIYWVVGALWVLLPLSSRLARQGSPKLIRGGKVLGVLSSSASLDLEAAGPTLPNIDTYDQGLLFLV